MADSRSPGGKKAALVEVIYFAPKRAPSALDELHDPRLAVPDFPPDQEELESDGPRAPAPRRRRSEAVVEPPKRRGEVESAAADTVRQKAEQLQELLGRSSGDTAPITRTQIAEMSLFGHHLFERGQLDEARAVFEKLVGLGVQEAFPHTMLGTIYLAQDSQDRALALFEAALGLDEGDLAARVYRAEIRLNAGKLDEACADLKQAIEQGLAEDPFVDRAKKLMQMAEERARRQRR